MRWVRSKIVRAGSGTLRDVYSLDHHWGYWPVSGAGPSHRYGVGDVLSLGDLPKYGVGAVQMGRGHGGSAIDTLGWTRRRAAFLLGGAITLLGVPAALDLDLLGAMDQLAGNLFLILGGLGLSLFVGWRMDDPIGEVSRGAEGVGWFFLWRALLRYVVPAVLAVVLFFSAQDSAQLLAELVSGGG